MFCWFRFRSRQQRFKTRCWIAKKMVYHLFKNYPWLCLEIFNGILFSTLRKERFFERGKELGVSWCEEVGFVIFSEEFVIKREISHCAESQNSTRLILQWIRKMLCLIFKLEHCLQMKLSIFKIGWVVFEKWINEVVNLYVGHPV